MVRIIIFIIAASVFLPVGFIAARQLKRLIDIKLKALEDKRQLEQTKALEDMWKK